MMAQTVLVTGGNGYVGGWCIVQLLQQGFEVRTTVRTLGKEAGVRGSIATQVADTSGLHVFAANLLEDEGWGEAMAGVDFVLHVASPLGQGATPNREALVAPARDGTLRVLRAAVRAGVERVVMTSAAAAARPPLTSRTISDESVWADPDDPQFDAYRVSKIRAERAAWEFMKNSGDKTELTTILPGAVFGPVLSSSNVGSVKIIEDLARGKPPAMPKLGFWVIDVRDLADAHIRAMTLPAAAGERFIVAGRFMWMAEIAAVLRTKLGLPAPTRELPSWLVRLLVPFMSDLRTLAPLVGRRLEIDTSKARNVLGISPRPVDATLIDCINSLRQTRE